MPLVPLLRMWACSAPDGATWEERDPYCPEHPKERLRPKPMMRYVGDCGCTWREALMQSDDYPIPTPYIAPVEPEALFTAAQMADLTKIRDAYRIQWEQH